MKTILQVDDTLTMPTHETFAPQVVERGRAG